MFSRIKPLLIVIAATFVLSFTIPQSYIGYMFGRRYDSTKDFTCCKGDQLYAHHFFVSKFFWVESGSGYATEAVGKPNPGGCNVQCSE